MPTTTSTEYRFDERRVLFIKVTTTTTNGSGVITNRTIARGSYPPTTPIDRLPSDVRTQAQAEWSQQVQQSWSDWLAEHQPDADEDLIGQPE